MQSRRRSLAATLLATLALSAAVAAKPPAAVPASPLPLATPESQGMSSERLERLHAEVQRFIDEGKHAGAVSLVARNGKIVDWRTYGKRDLEADRHQRRRPHPARRGALQAGRPHRDTSGLTYDFGDTPVEKINHDAKLAEAPSLADFVTRVSRLPLAHEPGERFTYGVSTDVLGALVEKVSGWTFGQFLEERLARLDRPVRLGGGGHHLRQPGPAGEDGRPPLRAALPLRRAQDLLALLHPRLRGDRELRRPFPHGGKQS